MNFDEHEFEERYWTWQHETSFMSNPQDIISNRSYLKIRDMGKSILYLVFRKLKKEPSIGLFYLLNHLTGVDPVRKENSGSIPFMAQDWLQWAFDNGYDESITHVPGYHLVPIGKGRFGEISKIREELDELEDAAVQDSKILQMVELSDIYGAMEAYAEKIGTSMEEIQKMSAITKRAFVNGKRKSS